MKKNVLMFVVSALVLVAMAVPAFAVEPFAMKESAGPTPPAGAPVPCSLAGGNTGSCANYRWYNVCNGYIWLFGGFAAGEGVGTLFGGTGNACVTPGNTVERVIYYFRNVVPSYSQTVDVFLDADNTGDGCPDANLGGQLDLDPAMRWNCVDYNVCLTTSYVIGRIVHDGGAAPTLATDGPFKTACDPLGTAHSYYYGINGSVCMPWDGPTTREDNWLMWLVVDSNCVNATEPTSWGNIKGLYQ